MSGVPGRDATERAASPAAEEHWEGTTVEALRAAWGLPALVVHRRTASTNDDARALAEAGAAAGTVVMADAQSAGRGRRGRVWTDGEGASVLLSMVWRPAGPAPGAAPLRAGLAVAAALETLGASHVAVKWPNDVLLDGRKVGGILCEGVMGGAAPFLVVGVGVNVAQETGDFPGELGATATSLAVALAGERRPAPSRLAVAAALTGALREAGHRATERLDTEEIAALTARDALRGRRVAVDGRPLGVVLGPAPDGALRVRLEDGAERLVRHGTVRPLDTAEWEAPR